MLPVWKCCQLPIPNWKLGAEHWIPATLATFVARAPPCGLCVRKHPVAASDLRQNVRNVGLVQRREGEAPLAEVVQRRPDVDQDGSVENQEPVVEPVRGLHGERIAELRVEGMATPCSVNAYGVCGEKRSRSGLSQFVITFRERCRLAGDIFVAGCRTPPRGWRRLGDRPTWRLGPSRRKQTWDPGIKRCGAMTGCAQWRGHCAHP